MAIRGILFDFDGTLANTTLLILATFHQTLDHFVPGNQVDDQTIINTSGTAWPGSLVARIRKRWTGWWPITASTIQPGMIP